MSLTAERWQSVMDMNSGTQLQWGPNSVDRYLKDPKRIAFMLSRYKFAAKMLRDCSSIIDVGCGDGMGTVTFLEDTEATRIQGVDMDASLIEFANTQLVPAVLNARDGGSKLGFIRHDLVKEFYTGPSYDGAVCLDVIEHVERGVHSAVFVSRLAGALSKDGIAVIGTPSALAAEYASPQSQVGHINLYTPDRFRDELRKHFRHVFLFSMNDEVVHTGFDKLAHYLLALCIK